MRFNGNKYLIKKLFGYNRFQNIIKELIILLGVMLAMVIKKYNEDKNKKAITEH